MRFIQGVSSEKARAGLKPDPPPVEHLKSMFGEGFTTPDNVQKKSYFHTILRGLNCKKTIILMTERPVGS
jgi:hypothetical protein